MSIAALLVALVILAAAIMLWPRPLPEPEPLPPADTQEEAADLQPVAAFSEIPDPDPSRSHGIARPRGE